MQDKIERSMKQQTAKGHESFIELPRNGIPVSSIFDRLHHKVEHHTLTLVFL